MKRIIIIGCLALTLAGCMSVPYTSKGAYLGAMHDMELNMQTLGFRPVGNSHETVNESTFISEDWKDYWVCYDTRQFVDTLGNAAAYTVRYREYEDGVISVELAGCDVTHPDDYATVCGDDGVAQRINSIKNDKEGTKEYTALGTAVVLGGCALFPLLILVAALL